VENGYRKEKKREKVEQEIEGEKERGDFILIWRQ
jgi:hypothetical protein